MTNRIRFILKLWILSLFCICIPAVSPGSMVWAALTSNGTTVIPYPLIPSHESLGPANAMGGAQTAFPDGILSVTANPAHVGLIGRFEVALAYKNTEEYLDVYSFCVGFNNPRIGALSLGFSRLDGDIYRDYLSELGWLTDDRILSTTFARRFGPCIAAGVSVKWIWIDNCYANGDGAVVDAGFIFMPGVGSPSGKPEDGLKIGISELNLPIRRIGHEYSYETLRFDIPSIHRVGISYVPVLTKTSRVTFACDIVRPDQDGTTVSFGVEDRLRLRSSGSLILRSGIRREDSAVKLSLGLAFSRKDRFEAGFSVAEQTEWSKLVGVYIRFMR